MHKLTCRSYFGLRIEASTDSVHVAKANGQNCRIDLQKFGSKDHIVKEFRSSDISMALSERIGKIEFLERGFSEAGPVGALTPMPLLDKSREFRGGNRIELRLISI